MVQLMQAREEHRQAQEAAEVDVGDLRMQLAIKEQQVMSLQEQLASLQSSIDQAWALVGEAERRRVQQQEQDTAAAEVLQLQLELALSEKADAEAGRAALLNEHEGLRQQVVLAQEQMHALALGGQLDKLGSRHAGSSTSAATLLSAFTTSASASEDGGDSNPLSHSLHSRGPSPDMLAQRSTSEQDSLHEMQQQVVTYKRELETAKSFGVALLQTNRQLQEEVRRLKAQAPALRYT
jgi:hypothetical protein